MARSAITFAIPLIRLALILLLLSLGAALITGVKFINDDPLVSVLPYPNAAGMTATFLSGALISGLLGGGVLIAHNDMPFTSRYGEIAITIWRILAFALPLGWLFDLSPTILAILQAAQGIIVIGFAGLLIFRPIEAKNAFQSALNTVWTTGIVAIGAGLILTSFASITPSDNFLRQTTLGVFGRSLHLHIGIPVTLIAIAFWLMHRISNITPSWAARGVFVCAGLVTLAGAWITLPALYPLGVAPIIRTIGSFGIVIVPTAYTIVAAHSYRALSDRNPTQTLSGHWLALGILLLLFGIGIVGGLQTLPDLALWTAGTRLAELQTSWIQAGAASVMLGMINYAGASARGQNMRVTGLLPFWLMTAGWLGGGVALGLAGVAQIYMERVLSVGYLETQTLLLPLHELWLVGWASAACGVVIYTTALTIRRPFVER